MKTAPVYTGMALLLLSLGATPPTAQAALVAYEPFDYAPAGAALLGANGGFGFSGPWQAGGFNVSTNANYTVASGSLAHPLLATQGQSGSATDVNAISGLYRPLTNSLGAPGSVIYISFILQPQGIIGSGAFNGFFGLVLDSPDEPEIFLGKPGSSPAANYTIENRGGAGAVASDVAPSLDASALIVLKAEFSTVGNDVFTMYVNPVAGQPEPASGWVKNDANISTITGLGLYSSGAFAIDELRVGETFEDVTPAHARPVPEGGTR